jgi:hypothetical protein
MYIFIHIYVYIFTHTHAHTYAHVFIYIYIYIHTHTHIYVHTHTHTHTITSYSQLLSTETFTFELVFPRFESSLLVYIPAYTHQHTHIHTYIQTITSSLSQSSPTKHSLLHLCSRVSSLAHLCLFVVLLDRSHRTTSMCTYTLHTSIHMYILLVSTLVDKTFTFALVFTRFESSLLVFVRCSTRQL